MTVPALYMDFFNTKCKIPRKPYYGKNDMLQPHAIYIFLPPPTVFPFVFHAPFRNK